MAEFRAEWREWLKLDSFDLHVAMKDARPKGRGDVVYLDKDHIPPGDVEILKKFYRDRGFVVW